MRANRSQSMTPRVMAATMQGCILKTPGQKIDKKSSSRFKDDLNVPDRHQARHPARYLPDGSCNDFASEFNDGVFCRFSLVHSFDNGV